MICDKKNCRFKSAGNLWCHKHTWTSHSLQPKTNAFSRSLKEDAYDLLPEKRMKLGKMQ